MSGQPRPAIISPVMSGAALFAESTGYEIDGAIVGDANVVLETIYLTAPTGIFIVVSGIEFIRDHVHKTGTEKIVSSWIAVDVGGGAHTDYCTVAINTTDIRRGAMMTDIALSPGETQAITIMGKLDSAGGGKHQIENIEITLMCALYIVEAPMEMEV